MFETAVDFLSPTHKGGMNQFLNIRAAHLLKKLDITIIVDVLIFAWYSYVQKNHFPSCSCASSQFVFAHVHQRIFFVFIYIITPKD